MPKDILYGEPPVSWQSVGCSLFQRGYLQKHRKLQCKPELSEKCRPKTDAMDASAQMRACVSTDVSGRKRFFFSYSLRQLCFVVHC